MVNLATLGVLLLSLLPMCISDSSCRIVNVRNELVRSGTISKVGTYRVKNDYSFARSWQCSFTVFGNRQAITRRIQIYDINKAAGACSRSVNISKGSYYEGLTLQLCGREKPQSYQDNWNNLTIWMSIFTEVNLTVEDVFVNGKPVLGNELELSVDAGWQTLISFGYPKGYPSFLNFTYILKSESSQNIEISVLDLDMDGYKSSLHCEDDYIDISDEETKHRWCQGRHTLTSQGPALNITMHTDAQGVAKGFKLQYRERYLSPPTSSSLTPTWSNSQPWIYFNVMAVEQPHNLTQINKIFHYDVDYRWIILTPMSSRIKLTFTNIDHGDEVPCSRARVTVYYDGVADGNELEVFCQHVTPGVSISWSAPVTIRLETHGIAPAQLDGFFLEYQSTTAGEVDSCNSTVHVLSDATYVTFSKGNSSYAYSPECWWKLQAPPRFLVSLQSEVVQPQYHRPSLCLGWLQVSDGFSSNAASVSRKVCGLNPLSVFSSGRTMLVRFHSDNNSSFSSFRLRVSAQRPVNTSGEARWMSVDVTDSVIIESPKAPAPDSSSSDSVGMGYHCSWRLLATDSADGLQLNLSSFHLGPASSCLNDYISVNHEGCRERYEPNLLHRACFGEQAFVTTLHSCMVVNVMSTRSFLFQGIRAEIRTYKTLDNGYSFSPNSVSFQAIFSVLAAIICIFIFVSSYRRCRQIMGRRRQRERERTNPATLPFLLRDFASWGARNPGPDQGRQNLSGSVSVISTNIFWNGAFSEQPPPYPGPMLDMSQMDLPPSYASVVGRQNPSILGDCPPYSED